MKGYRVSLMFVVLLLIGSIVYADWPTAGHDPQRTSWASEDIGVGACSNPVWCTKIYEFVPTRSHIITSETSNLVYATAADGIHALDPANGTEKWLYAMDPPPGDTPTVVGNVMYICGTDNTIHAINATTKAKIWQTYKAGAAFYCNPLVVNNKVYAGSHDGYFYCFNASDGSLDWYYNVGEPIEYSAAYQTYADHPEGLIFFAARDNRAYALRADNGNLVWKSPQLQVFRFSHYWPVVYKDLVFFACNVLFPQSSDLCHTQAAWINYSDAEINSHRNADGYVEFKSYRDWGKAHPYLRTTFVLDRNTGTELDSTVSPILHNSNPAGVRYPVAIGPNPGPSGPAELAWAFAAYMGTSNWGGAGWVGWQTSTDLMWILADGNEEAGDEGRSYSVVGDNYIYYTSGGDGYDGYGFERINGGTGNFMKYNDYKTAFGDYEGSYFKDRKYCNHKRWGSHGYQTPPVPLNGKVYLHRSCAVICYGT